MAEDIRLLTTTKNSILKLIEGLGLDPQQFYWAEEETSPSAYGRSAYQISVLVHTSSGFYYEFGSASDTYSPGETKRVVVHDTHKLDWVFGSGSRFGVVIEWLKYLKKQLDAPDLWQELIQQKQLSRVAVVPGPTAPFTPDERQYVAHQLEEVKRLLIEQHQLQAEQVEAMNQGFQSVVEAMDRFGRKDWYNFAIGTLVNVAVASAFAPAAARDLLRGFTHALAPLLDALFKMIGS